MSQHTSFEGLKRFLQHKDSLDPKKNPQGENGFAKEFQHIKESSSKLKKDKAYSTLHGEREVNRNKNRYKDILPFDHTRIILPDVEGVQGSDYINGNYIKNPSDEISYLAAQGPLPKTVDDFWRMIISHKIQVVVMACREYELGKLKCKRYWPENAEEEMSFAGRKITLESEDSMAEGFVVRTIAATDRKAKHIVTQFHYTAWPDHDVPRSPTPLIELTRSFRTFVGNQNVPVIIHCSAGCGRTGTICALDYAWTLLKTGQTDNLSVFEIVAALRRQRVAMVQTKEQYGLVYKAVAELVRNELRKQRLSDHTYMNVTVGEHPSETTEPTYENIAFIQSIQRLHQEEKRAVRRPAKSPTKPPAVKCPLNNGPAQKKKVDEKVQEKRNSKDVTVHDNLDAKENNLQLSKPTVVARKRSNSPKGIDTGSQNAEKTITEGKPVLTQRPPQEYVNVVLGNKSPDSSSNSDFKPAKPVPAKPTKPSKPAGYAKQMSYPIGSVDSKGIPPQVARSMSEYVVPSTQGSQVKDADYVVLPVASRSDNSEKQQQVPEGLLIDFHSPPVQTTAPAMPAKYENVTVPRKVPKARPEAILPDNHEPKSTNGPSPENNKQESRNRRRSSDGGPQLPDGIRTKRSDPVVHSKTRSPPTPEKPSMPFGQYSLVGAFEPPPSPRGKDSNPFAKAGTNPFRQEKSDSSSATSTGLPFGFGGSVVADSDDSKVVIKPGSPSEPGSVLFEASAKGSDSVTMVEKPVAVPRRKSDAVKPSSAESNGSTSTSGGPSARTAFLGSYSLVTFPTEDVKPEKKASEDLVQTSSRQPVRNVDMFSSKDKARSSPNLLLDDSTPERRRLMNGSFEPLSKQPLSKQKSLESDISSYGLVAAVRRKSEEVLSNGEDRVAPLYSSPDNDGPVRRKPLALRRSNSGGIIVQQKIPGDLYATVGARPKDARKRMPLAPDLWSPTATTNAPSTAPTVMERRGMRSHNSSSSLKSTTSASSDDTEDDLPPVPVKTAGAFVSLDEDEPYESVQTSSRPGTLDRFKAKAKAKAQSAMSRRQGGASPAHTPRSGSPVEGMTSPKDDLGYGGRVGRPCGPRDPPSHWRDFPSLKSS